jgi:hypothetical protein
MLYNRPKIIVFMMIFVLLAGGCSNDPDEIGIGIQPDSEKLNVFKTDTLSIFAHSVYVDSVRTDETSRTMLGSYSDPVFGNTTVGLSLQLLLSSASVELGDSPVLDSMVMSLEYSSVALSGAEDLAAYGDTTTPQTFRLFELDEPIYADSVYYSNYEVATKPDEIGSLTFEPHPTDSITIDTSRYNARLSIKMEDSFVQKFRDASADDFSSLENFLDFFQGLHIAPDEVSSGGAILFFNSGALQSRMTLYYSNSEEDSLEYYFPIGSSSARFMTFSHDYSTASPEFQNQLNGDTALGQQKFYLQAMAGVATIIEIPYFRELINQENIALNEARLIIPNADNGGAFIPPSELVIFNNSPDGTNTVVIDQFEGAEYFGGIYDESAGNVWFRLTQQLQQVLSGDTISPRFYLAISGASILPYRMVCKGSSPPDGSQGLKLELIFSKLNN